MTELERLGRALAAHMHNTNPVDMPAWEDMPEDCQEEVCCGVRTVLEALKEPTGDMIRAGNSAGFKATWRTVTTDVWQAMVSSILNEEPE